MARPLSGAKAAGCARRHASPRIRPPCQRARRQALGRAHPQPRPHERPCRQSPSRRRAPIRFRFRRFRCRFLPGRLFGLLIRGRFRHPFLRQRRRPQGRPLGRRLLGPPDRLPCLRDCPFRHRRRGQRRHRWTPNPPDRQPRYPCRRPSPFRRVAPCPLPSRRRAGRRCRPRRGGFRPVLAAPDPLAGGRCPGAIPRPLPQDAGAVRGALRRTARSRPAGACGAWGCRRSCHHLRYGRRSGIPPRGPAGYAGGRRLRAGGWGRGRSP